MKILTNLDLVKNQLLNCVIQKVAVDPTTKLAAGWVIFNTEESKLKYYNGEEWVTIGSDGGGSVDIATIIDSNSTNSKAAGAKAVYDFVIENLASKSNIYRKSNPALTTDANNDCSWVIDDIALEAGQYPSINLYEVNTGEMILADVSVDFTDEEITISFKNTGDISSGKYVAVIVV
jgi:hypothetical protein